jgi:phosphomannomutase/phosphoglucomutase
MDQSIFRAYSIRGVYGETLTADDMRQIGQAAGTWLGDKGVTRAAVGRDYRHSSEELAADLQEGLLSTGMDLADIGPCPTPLLNFATDHYRCGAGFMVTASHNPPRYNGLKIRTDRTLQGKELRQLYQIAQAGKLRRGRGTLAQADPRPAYLEALRRRATIGAPRRFVVDAAHGAAGPLVPRLLSSLGCSAVPLHCNPDGTFGNRTPDPTAAGALDALAERVVAEHADGGFAYDGDGDRVAMVDEIGRPVFADRLMILLARKVLATSPGASIVYELSCTQALPETIEAWGGQAIPCPIGYAFVHDAMRASNAILGVEAAGHVFFGDPEFSFDDAILATIRLATLLSLADLPLSRLLAQLPQYVRAPSQRLHCPDDLKDLAVARAGLALEKRRVRIERLDGIKAYLDGGWGLFRASKTQPAVTLHCEARDMDQLSDIQALMMDTVQTTLHSLGLNVQDAH